MTRKKGKRLHGIETIQVPQDYLLRLPVWIFYSIFIIWAYCVAKYYFQQNSVRLEMLDYIFYLWPKTTSAPGLKILINHLISLLLLLFICISAYGVGDMLISSFKINKISSFTEFILYSIGIGFGVIIFSVMCLGIIGLLYKSIIFVLLLIFACYGVKQFYSKRYSFSYNLVKREKKSFVELLGIIAICIAILVNLIGALTPETFYDPLVYNIGVPNTWIQYRKIVPLPHVASSFYPANISMLYIVGLLFKDEVLTKLIHFSFGLFTLLVIYIFSKKYFNRVVGILSGLVFYTVPLVMFVSWRSATELGLAFFEFLCIFSFIDYCQTDNIKKLILSAVFAGIAMGSKYTALFCGVAILVSVAIKVFLFEKIHFRKSLTKFVIFTIVIIAVALPWYMRSFILTGGNPIYPFFWKHIGHLQPRKFTFQDPRMFPLTWQNLFFFPWKITIDGNKFQQESYPGPLFLLLLPGVFVFKKISPIIKLSSIYLLIYLVLWIFIAKAYLRYFIPTLPILSIILVSYFFAVEKSRVLFQKILFLGVIYLSLSNVLFSMAMQKTTMDPLSYVLGRESKKEYLSTHRPTYPSPYYQVAEWLNKNVPSESKVIILGEARGHYFQRKYVTCTISDYNPFIELCKKVQTGDILAEQLTKNGFSHILVNFPEISRLSNEDFIYFDKKSLEIFTDFWNKYIREVYRDCAYDIRQTNIPGGSLRGNIETWNRYISDPFNYVYLYEILPSSDIPHTVPINFFLTPRIYSEERWKKITS